ncbi:MAG: type II toxin-antitoxin system VapC family toxin [Planctomycetes bacterium]|nr:type II toxin-antitoxin system VapC family toxin [Planctomycetota bacterium]
MIVLLDTHAFLWFVLGDPRLSELARETIAEPENDIVISPASYWEIAIKISIGKYSLEVPFQEFFEEQIVSNRFRILPIEPKHVAPLTSLPFHHRDPFDRLIVAQAIVEQISVVSNDSVLDHYDVDRLW